MAIIKKEIIKDPEVKYFVEETGEYYNSEERAAQALKYWERDQEKRKIDAEISIKLFGAKWIQYYGKNKLVLPQFVEECHGYKEGRDESFEDQLEYCSNVFAASDGVIDFGHPVGYERLFDKLINKGMTLKFNGSDDDYYFEPELSKFYIGCQNVKNEWGYTISPKIQNLRMAAFEYCKNYLK